MQSLEQCAQHRVHVPNVAARHRFENGIQAIKLR